MMVKRKLDSAVDGSLADQEIRKFGGMHLAEPGFMEGMQSSRRNLEGLKF